METPSTQERAQQVGEVNLDSLSLEDVDKVDNETLRAVLDSVVRQGSMSSMHSDHLQHGDSSG